jgi:hypothetical protein
MPVGGRVDDGQAERRAGAGSGQPAPKLLTTTQAARRINLVIVLMFAFAVPMVIISKAVIMWIAVLVVWIVLWIGWWLRWGRHWHPIRQFRYEWGGYRKGTFKRSSESEAAYREAWQESDGAPPRIPPSSGDTPK